MVSISAHMLSVSVLTKSVVWSVGVYTHSQLAAFLIEENLGHLHLFYFIFLTCLSIKYTVLVHPKGINIALYTPRGLISHT